MNTLFLGNGVNNTGGNLPWELLLSRITHTYGDQKIRITTEKPFPLLYEEIFLKKKASQNIEEIDLKKTIAEIVGDIEPNDIHERIWESGLNNILTTNYDYALQKCSKKSVKQITNTGHVKEQKYSVFRQNVIQSKRVWHVHGEVNVPNSITLGYEHYGGQLQHLRNYVVAGSTYKNSEINNQSLYSRLREKIEQRYSWVDSFYLDKVHVLGLRLGYEETDLWWLITNRARFFLDKKNHNIPMNTIIYYCPQKYHNENRDAILEANSIQVKYLKHEGKDFYHRALDEITRGN